MILITFFRKLDELENTRFGPNLEAINYFHGKLPAFHCNSIPFRIRLITFIRLECANNIKVLRNAENNFQYDIDKLIVKEAYCGKQVVMKRFRPRAKGRAAPIKKPYSNVTIILTETKKVEKHGTKS